MVRNQEKCNPKERRLASRILADLSVKTLLKLGDVEGIFKFILRENNLGCP